MAVMDFSPQLKNAAKAVFPNVVIGHDYFHSSQLLNRGVSKEFSRVKTHFFSRKIRSFKALMRATIAAEKDSKNRISLSSVPPYLRQAAQSYMEILQVFRSKCFQDFRRAWEALKASNAVQKWEHGRKVIEGVRDQLPQCGFTKKNYRTFAKKLCTTWRKYLREDRREIEAEKKEFTQLRFLILMNPKNMEDYHSRKLRRLLKIFPFLRPIREGVRKFHYQFKATPKSYRSLSFLKKMVTPQSHDKLKSAINTLIAEQDGIFAYREMYQRYPSLRKMKSIRSNNEHLNVKVNKVARNQYGFRSFANTISRLEGILDCPLIVSPALLSSGEKI